MLEHAAAQATNLQQEVDRLTPYEAQTKTLQRENAELRPLDKYQNFTEPVFPQVIEASAIGIFSAQGYNTTVQECGRSAVSQAFHDSQSFDDVC